MGMVYGYGRASTVEQVDTLLVQEEQCHCYYKMKMADKHTWAGMFLDKGVSGKTPFRQRPEGGRLALRLQPGDTIVISKMDRGFRDCRDCLNTLEWCKEKGVALAILDFGLDPLSVMGQLVATILAAFAEFERNRIGERIKEAKAQRKILGKPNNRRPAYGMKIIGKPGKRKYVPDPKTRECGKKFLEWFEAGWSHDTIYFHCLRHRIKTRLGGEWSRAAIERAIKGEAAIRAKEQSE